MIKQTDELLKELDNTSDINQYLSTNRDELIEQNVAKYLNELLFLNHIFTTFSEAKRVIHQEINYFKSPLQ